jgi:hypothetical protein
LKISASSRFLSRTLRVGSGLHCLSGVMQADRAGAGVPLVQLASCGDPEQQDAVLSHVVHACAVVTGAGKQQGDGKV